MNSFLTTYDRFKKSEEASEYKKYMRNFAGYVHTLGNFILVPAYFNRYRNGKVKDYWDLSLCCLKKAFGENNLWGKKGLFNQYINYFFLWDYVYVDDKDYKVKSLFKTHDDFIGNDSEKYIFEVGYYDNLREENKTNVFPEGDEIKNFLKNVNWAIRRRGIFMVAMLKIAQDHPTIYSSIIGTITKDGVFFNGYGEVFDHILEELFPCDKCGKDAEDCIHKEIKSILCSARKAIGVECNSSGQQKNN